MKGTKFFFFYFLFFLYMFGGVVNLLTESAHFAFGPLVKTKARFRTFWSNFTHDHDHLNLSGMLGVCRVVKVAGLTSKSMGLYSRFFFFDIYIYFFIFSFTVHGSLIYLN
jgi:hypothetical protein